MIWNACWTPLNMASSMTQYWSRIQILTGLSVAWLQWSDGNFFFPKVSSAELMVLLICLSSVRPPLSVNFCFKTLLPPSWLPGWSRLRSPPPCSQIEAILNPLAQITLAYTVLVTSVTKVVMCTFTLTAGLTKDICWRIHVIRIYIYIYISCVKLEPSHSIQGKKMPYRNRTLQGTHVAIAALELELQVCLVVAVRLTQDLTLILSAEKHQTKQQQKKQQLWNNNKNSSTAK